MPITPSPAEFRRQVDDWLRLLVEASPATEVALPEVEDLVISVFRCLRHWIDVRAIDERLLTWSTIDLSDVLAAVSNIQNAPQDLLQGHSENSLYYLSEAEMEIDRIQNSRLDLDNADIPDIFFTLDHQLEHSLLSVVDQWNASSLIGSVYKRIQLMPPPVIRKVWAAILRECDLDRHPGAEDSLASTRDETHPENRLGFLVQGSPAIPPNFFADTNALTDLKERIAQYTAWLRSRLYRDALRRGRRTFPANSPLGLARALSLKSPGGLLEPTEAERAVARAVGNLSIITTDSARLYRSAETLLSLDQRGPILKESARLRLNSGTTRERTLLFHLSRLLWACESVLGSTHPILNHLHRYKLRMELSSREIVQDLAGTFNDQDASEVLLQRDICRFLLIHGIHAVGTKFGQSETDVMVSDDTGTHLIEVKLYKEGLQHVRL